jgi:hypothetical protein
MIGKKNLGLQPTLLKDQFKSDWLQPTLSNKLLKIEELQPTLTI